MENFKINELFGPYMKHIKDLEGEQKAKGKQNEIAFTHGVETLRSNFPNPKINQLAELFYNLVGGQVITVAMVTVVEVVSFWAEKRGAETVGIIMVPEDFVDTCLSNPFLQLGALVNMASRTRDYSTGRIFIDSKEITHERALAYEAEYLITALEIDHTVKPNDYQLEVLQKYPHGLLSLPAELIYDLPAEIWPEEKQ